MTTLALHADDYLADAIRTAADEAGRSINVFLKELISASLGISARPRKIPAFMNVKRRLTLDTNVLIGFLREPERYADAFAEFDEIFLRRRSKLERMET